MLVNLICSRRWLEEGKKEPYGKKKYPTMVILLWYVVPSTPVDIAQFLPGFERNKIRK
jgi:hypothetical protein